MHEADIKVLYSVRSERQLVEQIHYNQLCRWFVGPVIEDAMWNHPAFSKTETGPPGSTLNRPGF